MKVFRFLLAGALSLGIASAASAATYVFNSNGTSFSSDGIGLNVKSSNGTVLNLASGLVVGRTKTDGSSSGGNSKIDGGNVVFTFSKPVSLKSFNLMGDNGSEAQVILSYGGVSLSLLSVNHVINLNLPSEITSFTLAPKSNGNGKGFFLSGLSLTGSASPSVPLPASFWLMATALAGLGLIARPRGRTAR